MRLFHRQFSVGAAILVFGSLTGAALVRAQDGPAASPDAGAAFLNAPAWPQAADEPATQTHDEPLSASQKAQAASGKMPALGPGEYGTDVDNENNANTHVADGDMDTYLYNTSSVSPIEFNIALPVGSVGKPGTLRLDVYDVDASSGEVDVVYLNGVKVGVLNGKSDTWGVNIFAIPPGVLRNGRNLVKVAIDTKNPNGGVWAVEINWGIIKIGSTVARPEIARCWIAPVQQSAGNYVNFFAELGDKVDSVRVSVAGRTLGLTDPDGDKVWSASWRIPATLAKKTYPFSMAAIKAGVVVSTCPALKVTN